MLIGIISECEGRKCEKGFLKRYVTERPQNLNNPFEIVVVRIPYVLVKFEKFSESRRLRIMRKAVRILKMESVQGIILSLGLRKYKDEIKNICGEIFTADGESEFYKFIPDAVRKIAPVCSINLLNAGVCISGKMQDRITEYLLNKMCYDIKKLTIYTDDKMSVMQICERFAEETGFFANVSDIKKQAGVSADIFIDIDKNTVRIGKNVIVDGVEFDFELSGYSVNMMDIAKCLGNVNLSERVISYICGKNKLTL